MSRYAAFLRGMNVGGHRLTNAELRAHFEALGFAQVDTFRASGNVVFAGEQRTPAAVRKEIEAGLRERLGYAVPSFIRNAEQLAAIAAARPFSPQELAASKGKLQVSFLLEEPAASARERLQELAGDRDRLKFDGCEMYWLPGAGVLGSQLDMTRIARELGATTMRTKGTVEQIFAKHFSA